jgi:uncharacterized membrane protein
VAFPRNFKRYLLTGLLVIGPFSLSLMLLVWSVSFLDNMLAPLIQTVWGRHVPGLGLILALAILVVTGFLSSNIVGHHLVEVFEDFLLKIPVFNWLYRTTKQLAEVFSPGGQAKFQRVVMVEYPRPEIFSLGFVTNHLEFRPGAKGGRELLCVYIPTNHLYIGDIIFVPEDKVVETGMSLQEGIQCFLSIGAAAPSVLPAHGPSKK